MPAADIAKMRKSGPPAQDFPTLSSPELEQVQKLIRLAATPYVRLKTEALDVVMRR